MITPTASKWIIKIVDTLLSPLTFSGEHRKEQWEKGWQQNIEEDDVIPRYFGKYPVVRRHGKFIDAPPGFEYEQLVRLERRVFTKYLKKSEQIYEFGCGTGHNLLTLRKVNRKAYLVGFDWVQSAVDSVQRLGFYSQKFDMFHPHDIYLKGSVFTVAALEQLGTRFHKFVDFLVRKKPDICVHLEPIAELMNPEDLLDYLQLQYMRARHYLSGFLTYLKELEKQGKVEIIEVSRNGVGSLFIEGYSLVVWRPV